MTRQKATERDRGLELVRECQRKYKIVKVLSKLLRWFEFDKWGLRLKYYERIWGISSKERIKTNEKE